jgi:ABC-2 type transport system ATP-binding protein
MRLDIPARASARYTLSQERTPMIDVVNVTHHYRLKPVLRHVNLRVNSGEIVAIMGPNGTGKTTLMQVMAGLIAPITGHVEVNGLRRRRTAEEELQIRRQTVWLPAEPWLPVGMTGRQWLLAVGRVYQVPDERLMEHVPRLMSLFNLEDPIDQSITSYSTGQKKKLALAAALVTDAPVMLLDEPFAGGLDPSGIIALKRVFQHHRTQRDATIVMATPVPELVEEVADRIAMLREGRIVAFDTLANLRRQAGTEGRLDEVYERIASPHTQAKVESYFREGSA